MVFVLSVLLTISLFISARSVPFFLYESDLQNTTAILNSVHDKEAAIRSSSDPTGNSSFARGIVNTNILTLFNYNGSQIYVYGSMANEADSSVTPRKWIFYYVPIMAPLSEHNSPWVWPFKNEVRVKLMLGDSVAGELARKAIEKKYDLKTVEYSKYWDIAPLMIDSLAAYIVQGSSSPITGVERYHAVHPNSFAMIFRFKCSTQEQAQQIAEMLDQGEYEIEIAFYFAGFRRVSTDLVSITGDQIKSVFRKTIADGGNTNAEYIHRSQASKFISLYNTNVQRMIYSESTDFNSELLSAEIGETFTSLMQQAMNELVQTKLSTEGYGQVWNSFDLNPNRIITELNKIFTYNKTATDVPHDGSNYFNINWQQLKKSAKERNVGFWPSISASLLDIILVVGSFGINVGHQTQTETSEAQQLIGYETISDKQIYDSLQRHGLYVEWANEKWELKSFDIFKIRELTDRLQTALISKQLIADKKQGAIIRLVSTMNTPRTMAIDKTYGIQFFLTGEVKLYAGVGVPPSPWLLCDGSPVLRIQYQRLFAVIGERYGPGDGVNTFNLPDFRGRVPLGVDANETRVKFAKEVGQSGGNATHQMTSSELPAHNHSQGSLYLSTTGAHNHNIADPGHNHGGKTSNAQMGPGKWGMKTVGGGYGNDQTMHTHDISTDFTKIQIQTAGNHTHVVYGETGLFGDGEAFNIIQPYQTINYIIYTG